MSDCSDPPCPRCLKLAQEGHIRPETVQPIPSGLGRAPLGLDGIKCCYDCAAADTLIRCGLIGKPKGRRDDKLFEMARIAVGNDRQEQYRLPGAPMGLVKEGLVRASKEGDFQRHLDWLDRQHWFGLRSDDEE